MQLSRDFYFVVFCGVLAAIPYLSLSQNGPSELSPYPLPYFLCFWFLGPFGLISLLVLPVFLWAWCSHLRSGENGIPRRSLVLLVIISSISIIHTLASYSDAARYQSAAYANLVTTLNLSFPLALLVLYFVVRRRASWQLAFAFHWLLLAWVGSYAFAYMGETP